MQYVDVKDVKALLLQHQLCKLHLRKLDLAVHQQMTLDKFWGDFSQSYITTIL